MMDRKVENRSLLIFAVGPYHFCAPVDVVEGVIMVPPITKIPMSPPSVAGSFVFRDHAAIAIDMWRKLDLGEHEKSSGLLIVTSLADELVAFQVESVTEIVQEGALTPYELPFAATCSLFEKFVLRGEDILLFTRFELLFEADDSGHHLEGLATFLKRNEPAALSSEAQNQASATSDVAAENLHGSLDSKSLPHKESPAEPVIVAGTGMVSEACATATEKFMAGPAAFERTEPAGQVTGRRIDARRGRDDGRRATTKPLIPPRKTVDTRAARTTRIPVALPVTGISWRPEKSRSRGAVSSTHKVDKGSNLPVILGGGLILLVFAMLLGFFMFGEDDSVKKSASSARIDKERQIQPAPVERKAPLMKSVKETAAISGTPEESMPVKKGADEALITSIQPPQEADRPPDSSANREFLRVETDDFTLTVERPPPVTPQAETASVSTSASLQPPKDDSQTAAGGINDITHTVVKGDTLWDIAEKHLGDPFRYHELAELSRVRDPHWIYPGDIIRIVRKEPQRLR